MLSPRMSHGGSADAGPEELKSEVREWEREREGGRASGEDWIGFLGGGGDGGGGGVADVVVADNFRDSGEATFPSSSSSSATSSENKEDEKPK